MCTQMVCFRNSPSDLSDAELNAIVSGLDKGGHVNPDEAYTPYVDDADIKMSSRAKFVLEELSAVAVHLRWPFRLMRTLSFNWKKSCAFSWGGRWLLVLSSELSKDERLRLPLPLSPYSSLRWLMGAHKRIVSERGLWAKLVWSGLE